MNIDGCSLKLMYGDVFEKLDHFCEICKNDKNDEENILYYSYFYEYVYPYLHINDKQYIDYLIEHYSWIIVNLSDDLGVNAADLPIYFLLKGFDTFNDYFKRYVMKFVYFKFISSASHILLKYEGEEKEDFIELLKKCCLRSGLAPTFNFDRCLKRILHKNES